jgi:FkbM family methyltransferase
MYDIVDELSARQGNKFDREIIVDVVRNNRYRLPERFSSTDIIIDIGAHIGSFAYACLTRGAGKIYLFEPDKQNCLMCRRNLRRYKGRIVLAQAAMWRSDVSCSELLYTGPTDTDEGRNYGGGNVVFGDGLQQPVPCEALESVLSGIRYVRLLKLDCESSEWPILFSCRLLECVGEIVGEYHEIGGRNNFGTIPCEARIQGYSEYTANDLVSFLTRQGFSVELLTQEDSSIGRFFAKRHSAGL